MINTIAAFSTLKTSPFIEVPAQTENGVQITVVTIPTANDSVTLVEARVTGIKSDGAKIFAAKIINGFKNDGGILTVGEEFDLSEFTIRSDSAYAFDWDVSGVNILGKVTGKAAETITWKVEYHKVVQFV